MPIIRARQPALTRVTQINRSGPTVIVPNRAAFGSAIVTFPYILNERFNEPNVTVFSDDFNRTDPAPWVPQGVGATIEIVNGELVVTNANDTARADYDEAVVIGKWYKVSVEAVAVSEGLAKLRLGTDFGQWTYFDATVPFGVTTVYLQATDTNLKIDLNNNDTFTGKSATWDNVLIQEVPALDGWDTSRSGDPSIVNGRMRLRSTGVDPGPSADMYKAFEVEAGRNYILTLDADARQATATGGEFRCGTTISGTDLVPITNIPAGSNQRWTASFTPIASGTVYVSVWLRDQAIGPYVDYDNITVQETLIENGTFDSDLSGWNAGAGWSWSAGTALHTPGSAAELQAPVTIAEGARMRTEIKVEGITAGSLTVAFGGGVTAGVIAEDGTYVFTTEWGTAASAFYRLIPSTSFDGAVDYAILQPVREI